MPGSLAAAILTAYVAPRRAMARQLAAGPSEPRALFHLLLACALLFVASLPNALRAARGLGIDDPVAATVAAHLFAYGAVAPLLLYGLAALLHLAARAAGGRGGFLAARAALFWSLLAGTPIALVLALVGVGFEAAGGAASPLTTWLGYAGLGVWLWLLAASLAEAEGLAGTGAVAAALAAAFAATAGLVRVVAGGTG